MMNLEEVIGRYLKIWEGQDPFLVFQIQIKHGSDHIKAYLLLDARQKKIEILREKPEGLKPAGSVVQLLRKHAPSGGFGRILKSKKNGDYWLSLFTERKATPNFYVHLFLGSPSELNVLTADGKTLVRRTTKGTYTKVKPWQDPLPHKADEVEILWEDVTEQVLSQLKNQSIPAEIAVTSPQHNVLPEYQRKARDRLARRVKTLRKALTSTQIKAGSEKEIDETKRKVETLADYFYRVKEGDFELIVDNIIVELNPELSAGANLDQWHVRLKKLKKAVTINQKQANQLERELALMSNDLSRLRMDTLSLRDVEEILVRNKLSLEQKMARSSRGITPIAQAWRTFEFIMGDLKIPIYVGKSAAGSDELCKSAKSNDWWFHAVGTTGSHVIIPARFLKGQSPHSELMRSAAILALHYSQRKDDQRGEVYLSRRSSIRKRPNMPPGLWQIDHADSFFVSYSDSELQQILANLVADSSAIFKH